MTRRCWAGLIVFTQLSGCAYRLTNLHIVNSNKIHSIAVESVFDTGGQVIPHEHLWNELQRSFASNGRLRVTSVDKADALVRVHLKESASEKSGNAVLRSAADEENKDPDLYISRNEPPRPEVLRDLTTAGNFYAKDTTSYVVDVEVWHLETRRLLLQRTYSRAAEILAVRESGSVPKELSFLRHEEALDRRFATTARSIAETVVTDLLVR